MSKCYNCGKEFTLKNEETICDSCNKVVNFPCHNCKQWFSVEDDKGNKRKECKVCKFFVCPNCNVCGITCEKNDWIIKLRKIGIDEEKIREVIHLIEDIKLNKDERNCPQGVPISYGMGRVKSCAVRLMGYRIKSETDLNAFIIRYETILDRKIGDILTINQTREDGSYGQEYRDVFNYCLCLGKLEKIKVRKLIDGEEVEFIGYKRVENGVCSYLDLNNLVIKRCKKCNKPYPLEQEFCSTCLYKKGKNKSQVVKLSLKISNKEICQLGRGGFKKEEDGQSKSYRNY